MRARFVNETYHITDQKILGPSVHILKGKSKEEILKLIDQEFGEEQKIHDWLIQNISPFMSGSAEISFIKNELLIIKLIKYSPICSEFGISKNDWNKGNYDVFSLAYGLKDFRNDITDKFSVNPDGTIRGTNLDVHALINLIVNLGLWQPT